MGLFLASLAGELEGDLRIRGASLPFFHPETNPDSLESGDTTGLHTTTYSLSLMERNRSAFSAFLG